MAGTSWNLEVDLISVGSGLGGACAAIAAHDLGLEVAILDKAPKLGGVCAYGGGEVFVPNNHKMQALGIADSDEAGRAYFEFIAAGFADPALQAKLLATMKTAVEYFEKQAGVIEGLKEFLNRRWRLLLLITWLLYCAWLIYARWNYITGFVLSDTDDNMRISQVRALLAGQDWFDLRQYEMNWPQGANIHWSRLVDLPLAGLILLGRLFAKMDCLKYVAVLRQRQRNRMIGIGLKLNILPIPSLRIGI